MEITKNRLHHILAVAQRMENIVEKHGQTLFHLQLQELQQACREAFVLGMLHDVGYEFVSEQTEHAHAGGTVLKEQGYQYWREVYYHGSIQTEYRSPMLNLLNYADMTTGPDGTYLTIYERVKDIEVRYGKGSSQATEAAELGECLSLWAETHGIVSD